VKARELAEAAKKSLQEARAGAVCRATEWINCQI